MNMNKRIENKLISLLDDTSISIPTLQLKMKLSYRDAAYLLQYAIGQGWVDKVPEGIDYPILTKELRRRELSEEACKKVNSVLDFDALRVLCYLGKNVGATLNDILADVDHDREDMLNALHDLIMSRLVFEVEQTYFCRISQSSTQMIKKNERHPSTSELTARLRHLVDES